MMTKGIAEYPDSDKVGVLAQFPAKGDGKPTVMRYIIRNQGSKRWPRQSCRSSRQFLTRQVLR